ncbi:MAG: DUF4157 domain-containing protein [Anaerolineae bacterium]
MASRPLEAQTEHKRDIKRRLNTKDVQAGSHEFEADTASSYAARDWSPDPSIAIRALDYPPAVRPEHLLTLQRTLGNRQVARLIQRKLVVGAAHDPYEQEADRVAQQVVSRQSGTEIAGVGSLSPVVSGLSAAQTSRTTDEESFEAEGSFENHVNTSRGSGSPLPGETRKFFESRMGADFGGVRVHADGQSAQLNREVSAQAFTQGQDIYLGEGKGDLESTEGKKLLAHELTHVVQQTGGEGSHKPVQRQLTNVIQRKNPFKKRKRDKRTQDQKALEETGRLAKGSSPYLVLRLGVKTNTAVRGKQTFKEFTDGIAGHAFIDLELGRDYTYEMLEETEEGEQVKEAIEQRPLTAGNLQDQFKTSLGFFPKGKNPISGSNIVKQLFGGISGELREPDTISKGEPGYVSKNYVITTPAQAARLIGYIQAHENSPYNLFRYNCTDFAVGAVAAAGFDPPSNINGLLSVTSPNLLYKKLFKRAHKGDRSTGVADLKNKETGEDKAHLSKKSMKKLVKARGRNVRVSAPDPETRPLTGERPKRPERALELGPRLIVEGPLDLLDRNMQEPVLELSSHDEEAVIQTTGKTKENGLYHEVLINGETLGWISRIDLRDARPEAQQQQGEGDAPQTNPDAEQLDPEALNELLLVIDNVEGTN